MQSWFSIWACVVHAHYWEKVLLRGRNSAGLNAWTMTSIGPLRDPLTMYGINYAGTQITQWYFQNKGTRTSPAWLSFVLKVPLRYLCPSIIYSYHVTGSCKEPIFNMASCALLPQTLPCSNIEMNQYSLRVHQLVYCPWTFVLCIYTKKFVPLSFSEHVPWCVWPFILPIVR